MLPFPVTDGVPDCVISLSGRVQLKQKSRKRRQIFLGLTHSAGRCGLKPHLPRVIGAPSLAALYPEFEDKRRLLVIKFTCDPRHNDPQTVVVDAPFTEVEEESRVLPRHHRRSFDVLPR